jgi:hypothetical protein
MPGLLDTTRRNNPTQPETAPQPRPATVLRGAADVAPALAQCPTAMTPQGLAPARCSRHRARTIGRGLVRRRAVSTVTDTVDGPRSGTPRSARAKTMRRPISVSASPPGAPSSWASWETIPAHRGRAGPARGPRRSIRLPLPRCLAAAAMPFGNARRSITGENERYRCSISPDRTTLFGSPPRRR